MPTQSPLGTLLPITPPDALGSTLERHCLERFPVYSPMALASSTILGATAGGGGYMSSKVSLAVSLRSSPFGGCNRNLKSGSVGVPSRSSDSSFSVTSTDTAQIRPETRQPLTSRHIYPSSRSVVTDSTVGDQLAYDSLLISSFAPAPISVLPQESTPFLSLFRRSSTTWATRLPPHKDYLPLHTSQPLSR